MKTALNGRVALVTGAGRGIGRSIALGLAREGVHIAVTARTESELNSVVDQIRSIGREAIAIPADLTDRAAPARIVRQVNERLGTIDILVNNAGVGSALDPKPLLSFDDDFWEMTLAVNLTAPYLFCKAALPILVKKQRGRIINIASIMSRAGCLHGAAYSASKHALLGLTRSLALETARKGITVNAICPGPVRTSLNRKRMMYDAERLGVKFEDLEARVTPIGRILEPQEVVPIALLLAGDESAAITGQAFNICGGLIMS